MAVMMLGLAVIGMSPRLFFPSEYPLQMFDLAALGLALKMCLEDDIMPSSAFLSLCAMSAAIMVLGSATLAWLGLALVASLLVIWHPERRLAAVVLLGIALYQGPGLFVINQVADLIVTFEAKAVAGIMSPLFTNFTAVDNILVSEQGQMIVLLGCSALPAIAGTVMLHCAVAAWAGAKSYAPLCLSALIGCLFLFFLNAVRLACMAYEPSFNAIMHTEYAAFAYGILTSLSAAGVLIILSAGSENEGQDMKEVAL
jgi:hypothetical protein